MSRTVFEKSKPGRRGYLIPENDCPTGAIDLPGMRTTPLGLPEMGEQDIVRHYIELASKNYHVDKGIYPLGSCTMKYPV